MMCDLMSKCIYCTSGIFCCTHKLIQETFQIYIYIVPWGCVLQIQGQVLQNENRVYRVLSRQTKGAVGGMSTGSLGGYIPHTFW